MPRRGRQRPNQARQRSKPAALASVTDGVTRLVIDSDQETTSLTSSVCDDYFANLMESGLDLTSAGKPTTPEREVAAPERVAQVSKSQAAQERSLSPLLQSSGRPGAQQMQDMEATDFELNMTARDLGTGIADLPAAQPSVEVLPVTNCSASAAQSESTAAVRKRYPPALGLDHLTHSRRATWLLIESEAMAAFHYFQKNPTRGTTFTCAEMPEPLARLGMHRASEVLGSQSVSTGEGALRRVTLTWTKDGTFSISEDSVLMAVRGVLQGLFGQRGGRKEGGHSAKRMRKERRREEIFERKLEAAAQFADAQVDPVLVEEFVAKRDWEALENLFQGVPIPGHSRRKKGGKKARARERKLAEEARRGAEGPSFEDPLQSPFRPEWADGIRVQRGPSATPRVGTSREGRDIANKRRPRDSALHAKPLEKSNKGFAMLERMGWKEGEGLGVEKEGLKEPLQTSMQTTRAGLGIQSQRRA